MRNLELLVFILVLVTALARLADRVRLPYPILLVLAGIGLSLVPGLPRVVLAPDLVFFGFLPPLLYAAAWNTSWPDLRRRGGPAQTAALTRERCALQPRPGLPLFSGCWPNWLGPALPAECLSRSTADKAHKERVPAPPARGPSWTPARPCARPPPPPGMASSGARAPLRAR